MLGKLFNIKKSRVGDIGLPTDMRQIVHVSKNSETGKLEGLPTDWSVFLDQQVTPTEKNENPKAATHAIKLPIIKRRAPDIPMKPSHIDKVITEEYKEKENLVDHIVTIGQNSEEEVNNIKKCSQKETLTSVEKNENSNAAMLAVTHPKCFSGGESFKMPKDDAHNEEN